MKKILLIIIFLLAHSINAQAGSRYISIAPSTTEILFALGLNDEIVGVSSYCNYPPETKNKRKVGNFSDPNIEEITRLKPDYIFCTGLEQAGVIRKLKNLKFNVYVADPANFEELMKSITEIGKITNRTTEAEALLTKILADIKEITDKARLIPKEKRLKVFIEIWHEPLMTAGKGSFLDELIALAGGINIAYNVKRPFSNYSAEEVVKSDPDCVIMTYMDRSSPVELVKRRFGWQNINAVKNNKVFNDINPDILLRPGPRISEGLKEIYRRLYD